MILIVLLILCIHWFADFVLQTHHQATSKDKKLKALLMHTSMYSLCWFALWPVLHMNTFYFVGITFIAHSCTDYFTSKLNAKLRIEKKERAFFISLGFDQLLHSIQLILTYNYFYESA